MSKINILSLFLFIFLSASCSYENPNQEMEVSEVSVSSFEKVHLTGGGKLHFIPSDNYSVELRGRGISGTTVKVKGGKLHLDNKGKSGSQNVDIFIYTPYITGIQINGGGTVDIEEGFDPVERFDCVIQGGGKMALETLEIGTLDVSILGGGAITAQVEDVITANILGGGSIRYLGNPEVRSSIVGGGTIKQKDS